MPRGVQKVPEGVQKVPEGVQKVLRRIFLQQKKIKTKRRAFQEENPAGVLLLKKTC